MSKKLIAVASTAALALSALVGIAPANASFAGPAIVDAGTGSGLTAALALETGANELNTIVNLGASDNRPTNTAARIAYSSLTNGKVVSVRTGSTTIKFLEKSTAEGAAATPVQTINASSGATSLDLTVTAGAVVFYAHSVSTTAESFTVSYDGNTTVYWIKAKLGKPYNVSATFPTAIGASATGDVVVKVTDHRGNAVKGTTDGAGWVADANSQSVTLITTVIGAGTRVGNSDGSSLTWSVSRDAWIAKISGGASGGNLAATVTLGATDLSAAGFAAPVLSAFGTVTAANLAGLTAQVAALQAQIANMRTKARSVTKKKYNTLARKWNRANPTDRVALKK